MLDLYELNFDTNGDGVNDALMFDSNGDGLFDSAMFDTNIDGVVDQITSYYDTTGDGYIDMIVTQTDSDFDGYPEQVTTEIDTNGDGIMDMTSVESDSNMDGMTDSIIKASDYDQDGIIDHITTFADNDADGAFDQVIKQHDSNDDGILDTSESNFDFNNDGHSDAVIKETIEDTDNNGEYDTYTVSTDENEDGEFEAIEVYEYNEYTEPLELSSLDLPQNNLGETYDVLDTYDPSQSDPDCVTGNPEEAMNVWECQGDTNRCAVYAQKFVIEELTGQDIDIEEFADIAERNGWFSEENGTPMLNMNKMLDAYGIENEMTFDNTIDDIKECLDNGKKVIVSIDADEIWYGAEEDLFSPTDSANHAVEVIGIDNSNPDEPMVILNDSGTPNGCGEMVPLDMFLDAWEDSNCELISAG